MLDNLIKAIDMNLMNLIGSAASVIGVLLTFYVMLSLRKIRNEYIFKGRIPKLRKNLQGHTSKLSQMLKNYNESIYEIEHEIALALVDIKSINSKVGGSVKKSTKSLIKDINNYQTNKDKDEKSVRDLYVKCNMLLLEINNLSEDINWS